METLGQRLRAERMAQSKTQLDLAVAGGVSKQAIAKIESGDTAHPAATTIEPIARVLGVSVRWLTTGKGQKAGAAADDAWADIRGYKVAASLGDGSPPDEYAEAYKLKFRAESLARKRLRMEAKLAGKL
ncbi:MAG TPA: helix-turn-helix transcriptional regulator [Dokdonella sp.]|nr:helix-turn-helix transcriptional regulator [Dokdonella sp.]